MAATGNGIIILGLYFFVGCVLQISHNALVQDVNIVPAQGQQGGNPPNLWPQNTGHYPHYHAYPQDPAYQVPGQTGAQPDPQYAYNDQVYNPQSGGQLTPGQSAQQQMPYPDQFNPNQAAGGYPPPARQPYLGASDPSLSQTQSAQEAQAQANQGQGSQGQNQPQVQPAEQAQQPPPMSASQSRMSMMQMSYQQNVGPSGQNPQQMNPQYPYPYTGHYPPQAYAGQPPLGYPGAQSNMMQESGGYPGANSPANTDPSGQTGATAVGAEQKPAPGAGASPQSFQQPPVGSNPGQGFQPNAGPDPAQGYQQPPGSNPSQGFAPPPASNQPQGFAPPPASNQPQGFAPPPASNQPQGFAAGAPGSDTNQGFSQQSNQAFAPVAPGQSPQGFLQPGAQQNPNAPYSGLPPQNAGMNQGGGQQGEAASQPAAGPKPADVPASSAVSTQRQAAYKGQLTNAIQYNLADQKSFAPNGAPDPQSNMVANGQSGFSGPQGQPAGGANPAGLPYPQQQPAPAQQYQQGPYLGQSPGGAGPQQYPMRSPYPYNQPYAGQPPYQGPMPPYPGQGGIPYTDQQGRPFYPAPKSTLSASRTQKQGPQMGPNQLPLDQSAQRLPYQRDPQQKGYPPNNMQPPTTTPMPETTQPASTFPPELRCYSQNECEVGCCYASDGSVLVDTPGAAYNSAGSQRREGYCYTKTSTVPGDGCIPGVCPCQGMDQVCVSVPSENATIPPMMGEMAEGALLGNPKCYTPEQQMQIMDWLKKLDTIVTVCRLDPDCPLTIMH